MSSIRFPIALFALLACSVFAQEDDLFESAKLEAEEFMNDVLEKYLPTSLAQDEYPMKNFSCYIPRDLLLGFFPTHRDIRATFSSGTYGGVDALKTLNCRPSAEEPMNGVSLTCTMVLEQLRVKYQADVTGFDLKGTHSSKLVTAKVKHLYTVTMTQSLPERPKIAEILPLITRTFDLEVGTFGFNSARRARLLQCVDSGIRRELKKALEADLLRLLGDALSRSDRDLPEPHLESDQS
ncbi:uncharacterized protein LOC100908216 [Galendromus occidentalis]|uniref:Uncharacterized protein LOC100908216 n=1 Tax=Galendromus occidentalis TaxID=34638 RepID=A0AAJ6VWS0_9ACAR|nr:uncharacterized protein LOC100908216 [Galendromus occidentalis]